MVETVKTIYGVMEIEVVLVEVYVVVVDKQEEERDLIYVYCYIDLYFSSVMCCVIFR